MRSTMEASTTYTIAFKALPDGRHSFDFEVGEQLFGQIENALVSDGKLKAKVEMTKSEHMLKFHCAVAGTVRVKCDVCLDDFDYEVEDCEGELVAKFGEKAEEISDELIVIDRADNEIDLGQWIYELICISLPIRFEHPLDDDGHSTCDSAMLAYLDKYIVKEKTDSDASQAESSDPRWDELKRMLNNNN